MHFLCYLPQLGFILGTDLLQTCLFLFEPFFDEVRQVVRGSSSPCRYTIVPWLPSKRQEDK